MKTSVFQTALAFLLLTAKKRPSAGQTGPHKDKQLTPHASEGKKKKTRIHTSSPVTIWIHTSLAVSIFPDIHCIHSPEALTIFLSLLSIPLSSSLLFNLPPCKWGIISFSIFPRSSPLLPYSTSIISPPRLAYWLARGIREGHAFSLMSVRVHAEGERKAASNGERPGAGEG